MPFLAVGRQPLAADLVAHIEHAINICGEDHVGIGTDGTVTQIDDMKTLSERPGRRGPPAPRRRHQRPGERPDIVPFLPDLTGRTNSNWPTCWQSVATAAAALKKSWARTSCAWPMAYGAEMTLKYAALALSIATLAAHAGTANTQQERLDKLNGKALGRVIYRGATLIDGTPPRRAPTWPSSSRTTASKPSCPAAS
jgi:hypothetical protein